jgi:3-hydroxybutyryl-CoA dehydrogenase
MSIERVGVVGAGQMGAGIAEVMARAGLPTIVKEADHSALSAAMERIRKSLDRGVAREKITSEESEMARDLLTATTEWSGFDEVDLVVEAVVEDTQLKQMVFRRLDEETKPSAILASNTSSIPIMKLAVVTDRPSNVLGLHFFNPVPVMHLVEVVQSLTTGEEALQEARDFVEKVLRKRPVLSKDRAGFIVNYLLIPYILSAIRLFESGFASKDDIDAGMVEGCNHPMGPLALADLIGNDTVLYVAQSLYEEFKEPLYAPPPLLSRMVEAGLLGRKTGKGFYDYP